MRKKPDCRRDGEISVQGANQSIQDALCLAQQLEKLGGRHSTLAGDQRMMLTSLLPGGLAWMFLTAPHIGNFARDHFR